MSKRKVLLLHTGGTLGMKGRPLQPDAYAAHMSDQVPELEELAEIESRIVCNVDSSDMSPEIWGERATAIADGRGKFDGAVIVHGTDTMAYTASALSFALEGLDMPVILTGAQRPLAALRTDARRNLADSVELAARGDIPEVGICFDGLLLRGCRTTKSNAQDYRAFESPTCPPLARLGVDIEVGTHIRRPTAPFRCDHRFSDRVLAMHVTPGLDPSLLSCLLEQSEIEGLVLSVFGVGTVPSKQRELGSVLARAIDAGVEVLAITPSAGSVNLGLYQNSKPLLDAGVIPGGRLSIEAATTKLMHAIAIHENRTNRRDYLAWNVAGELA